MRPSLDRLSVERLSRVSLTSSMVLVRKEWGRSRRWLMLLYAALGGIVLGVVLFLAIPNEADHYRTVGAQVAQLRKQSFDGFWACSLRGAQPAALRDSVAIANEIHRRGAQGRGSFGLHVRTRCLGMLQALASGVRRVQGPKALSADIQALAEAADRLVASWQRHIAFLAALDDRYDPVKAEQNVTDIARSWQDYRRAYAVLTKDIRSKLGIARDYY